MVVLATAPYPLSPLVVILVGRGVVDIVRFQVYKLVYPAARGPSRLEQANSNRPPHAHNLKQSSLNCISTPLEPLEPSSADMSTPISAYTFDAEGMTWITCDLCSGSFQRGS